MSLDLVPPLSAVAAAAALIPFIYRLTLRLRLRRLERLHLRRIQLEFAALDETGPADGDRPFRFPAKGLKITRRRLSASRLLLGFAVRRLPESMTEEEKERWVREMSADAAGISRRRLRRFRFAFNVWRKGAPQMPAGEEPAARPARD
jgi:hypothetical protein